MPCLCFELQHKNRHKFEMLLNLRNRNQLFNSFGLFEFLISQIIIKESLITL